MSGYSFPNQADDVKSRLNYTMAAEFIYRLDQFLEHEHRSAAHGPLPIDTIAVVQHCCEAAIDMFCSLASSWNDACTTGSAKKVLPKHLPVNNSEAMEIILGTVEVVTARFHATNCSPKSASAVLAKWELMFTLGTEFFLELGAMTEIVLGKSAVEVDQVDVNMLRGCLDAAMGMVYELSSVAWPEGHEVPARAVLGMHNNVISCSLEDAGPEAVSLISDVYRAVTRQVMEGY